MSPEPTHPRVPTTSPLLRKLGVKPDARLGLLGLPAELDPAFSELPPGVTVLRRASGPLDLIVSFHTSRIELRRRLPVVKAALEPAGGLWIAWPKRASGMETDLSEAVVRQLGLASGLVDNKICAVNETWSGLRFVYRLRDRPA